MGGSKKQTVGYWYNWAMCFGWCKGPVDAFLEFRAGDKTAWQGRMTSSGQININKPNLWGGEDSTSGGTGGIVGDMDIMFGEADQAPNDYLISTFGPQQSARRGKFCTVFRGGKFGAFVANPKPVSAKIERILADWQGDTVWYPEKAVIPLRFDPIVADDWVHVALICDGDTVSMYVRGRLKGTAVLDYEPNGGSGGYTTVGRYRATNPGGEYDGLIDRFRVTTAVRWSGDFDPTHLAYGEADPLNDSVIMELQMDGADGSTVFVDECGNAWSTSTTGAAITTEDAIAGGASGKFSGGYISTPYASGLNVGSHFTADCWIKPGALGGTIFTLNQHDSVHSGYGLSVSSDGSVSAGFGRNTWPSDPVLIYENAESQGSLRGMNPAHILYDSLTHADMQGEPTGAVSDDSFRAAADKLYGEAFGLCTDYDSSQETPQQFQQRICNVIGASLSQSRVDGLYYLDLIRGDYDLDSLPIIGEDDIISFSQDPSVITETGNKLSVEWFDPQGKETRTTAPVFSMGNVRSAGRVIPADTKKYPEIPVESLALRVASRDLKSTAVPLNKFDLTTRATMRALRPGMNARLQVPSEGIADMVVVIGSVAHGTSTKGDMKIVAVQNVYSMPSTVYVTPQDGLWVPPATIPTASPHELAIEAPYVELANSLSNADLAALPADAGYLLTVATRPTVGSSYGVSTAAAGEDYASRGTGDWCPTATINETAGYLDTAFTIAGGELLDRVVVGSWALWGQEIVRIAGIDADAGTLTVGRGCGDTVPAKHDAAERIYFCGDWVGSDQREYVGGDSVDAKLLTRTGSDELALADAVALHVDMSDRASRPYAPGQCRVNGEADPDAIVGAVAVTGVHRDRLQQADQLVDSEMAGIGPEAGTTYTVRYYINGTLAHTDSGLSAPSSSYSPTAGGIMHVEMESVRDGLTSYQMHVREFAVGSPLQDESGALITTEDDQPILMG